MQEDKTIIGIGDGGHRIIHGIITIPFLIIEGILFYVLYTSPNPEIKDGIIVFVLGMISLPYVVILRLITKSFSETVIIDKYYLTLTHRTLLLTIPSYKTILLDDIASVHRDDDYLHLYNKRGELLLEISDRINETKEIVKELKKRLPNVEYSEYSIVSNVSKTYTMSNVICTLMIIFWLVIGAMILINLQEKRIYSIIFWSVIMLLIIFYSSQKVVMTKDRLTYTGRKLFMAPFVESIQISDIASMGGDRYTLVLYDKEGKPLMEIQKNIFFFTQLTRALEIRISNREDTPS